MMKIAVIPNKDKDNGLSATKEIIGLIRESGSAAVLSKEFAGCGEAAEFVDEADLGKVDLIVAIGGDGTILSTARRFYHCDVPILGINHGRLGFLAEVERADSRRFREILKGNYSVARHMTIDVAAGGKVFPALNDAVIHRDGFSRMIEFSIYIEDRLVSTTLSDGLIISTPTGSTAYSLSAGGPIADPELEVILLTHICPHDLYSRSMIVPAAKSVRVVIGGAPRNRVTLTVDGQEGHPLREGGDIVVSGGKKIGLARGVGSSFYEKLKRKMFEKRTRGV